MKLNIANLLWSIAFFLVCAVGVQNGFSAELVINEILASSHASDPDPDFGQISDWIEIYNAGTSSINLGDYYLTDNFSTPKKWHFPSYILDANDYLVIWADDQDTDDSALHTNFKLDNNGEVVGIYAADGSVVDTLSFREQLRDVSFGRATNNQNQLLYFEQPTPGRANASGFASDQTAADVSIDAPSGFYSGTLSASLTTSSTSIRYTTDGSVPDRNAMLYTSPINMSQTTVLKARAFDSHKLPGPVATRTYFINETTTLPVFSLTADPDHLWDNDIGIYVDENIASRKEWERPGYLEFFEDDGHLAFEQETSIRLFGRTAIYIPQKSLSFFFSNTLRYPLFSDHYVKEFDSFLLRSSSDDWHLTMFRDGFIQEMVQANLHMDTQDYRPAVLFINGEYWGIHNIREKYNESYVATHHDVDADNIDMLYIDEREEEITVLAGDRVHYDAMINFAENNDLSDPANYQTISQMVDIDNLIDYSIAEVYIGNRSWPWNIRAWRPRTTDGKWQWLIFDLDRGFRYADENLLRNDEMMGRFHPFAELLDNENFKNLFIERLLEYSNGALQPDSLVPLLDSLQANIADEIPRHADRWRDACGNGVCGINSIDDWNNSVENMRSIVQQRQEIVQNQLADYFNFGSTVQLDVRIQQPGYGVVQIGEHTTVADSFSGFFFRNSTADLLAMPNNGFQFLGWKQNTGSATTLLPRGSTWTYFDQGYLPADNWMSTNFDDSGWASGPAELGYGDNDEQTVISYGGDSNDKYITTYFRTDFSVDNTSDIESVTMQLKRDDGAVVYLNGAEIVRSNMPAGNIHYDTVASEGASDENSFLEFTISPSALQNGSNTLAVEIHQRSASSSDISFDLELEAYYTAENDTYFSKEPVLHLDLTDNVSLAAVFASNSQHELPAQISQNTTLSAAQSPYLAMQDVFVQPGVTLTMEEGAAIYFASEASLIINGQLVAIGTAKNPISLNGLGDGRWGALCIEDATGQSILSHVTINGATTGPDASHFKAAVSSWASDVTLDYVHIENVNQPLYANGGTIILTNSLLDGTASGDDIANIQYASARVEDSHLFGNGELDFDSVNNGIIRNNRIDIISTNTNRDGIDIGASDNVLIENNRIFNCPDNGISVGEASNNAVVRGNLVVNASMGVAIKDASYALIDHNTFYNADTGVACYEKIAGQGGGHAEVSNSIFAGQFSNEFTTDELSSIEIRYSLSEQSQVDGTGNLAGAAHFTNALKNNFHLSNLSPCIDAGDPSSEKDADGTRADIGAYFFNQGPISTNGLVINEFMADNTQSYMDEFGEFDDWIELYNGSDSPIDVAGLYLTDDVNTPTLWRIADYAVDSTTIAPKGFLVLWADKDSLQGLLHAGFKLNADTEQIALVKADKDHNQITVVDSITYSAQQPDISYGRVHDGAQDWQLFSIPTPGWANGTVTDTSSENVRPTRFVVHPNYPNPFNPQTTITYELPRDLHVTVEIFNALGQRVNVLLDANNQAGIHHITWRAVNAEGQPVSSGLYFYKVTAGEHSAIGKMMLLQ